MLINRNKDDYKKRYAIIFTVVLVFALCGDMFATHFIKHVTNPHDILFHTGEKKDYDLYQVSYFYELEPHDILYKISNNEEFYLILSRESCYTCGEYLPIVNDVFGDKNISNIYYLNRGKYNKEDDEFKNLIDTYPNMMYTPYIMYFKDGKLVRDLIGNNDKDKLYEWLN